MSKRKNVESASSSAPPRRSRRLERQDSDIAVVTSNLKLASSDDYGLEDLPSSASKFKKKDVDALKVSFRPAPTEDHIIPGVKVTNFPEQYVLPEVNHHMLRSPDFDVDTFGEIWGSSTQTFIDKLHDVVENSVEAIGTSETHTDSLVDNLLRIVGLDDWPLKIKNHPLCRLFVEGEPYVSADPEFVINKRKIAMMIVEDKHLKNVVPTKDFGETQIAIEILACGDENIRQAGEITDQTIFAARVISMYVTFYKAVIPTKYWVELGDGLPKEHSVVVERWPADNGLKTGFDLAEPAGRRAVLTALVKIREYLLQ